MGRTTGLLHVLYALAYTGAHGAGIRSLQQANQDPNNGAWISVSGDKPNIDAITAYYCNVSGDSRLAPWGAFFPLHVQVPVGLSSRVIFANITGTIPGTEDNPQGNPPSGGQQQGTSVVQQPGTSVVQQPGTSVVQQSETTVVQPTPAPTTPAPQPKHLPCFPFLPCHNPFSKHSCKSAQTPAPTQPTTVVQQPGTSVVQQPGSSVVQQPGSSVVQQPGSSVVQQPGRKLQQSPAPIEYISNDWSEGQPELFIFDTVEGVPHIIYTPTAAGQKAAFKGGLHVAVTTTGDGFGEPYIPYRIEPSLNPDCQLEVRFEAI